MLGLAEFLRQNGWCFVYRGGVREQINKLESAFPALVTAMQSRSSDEDITRLLRALARERVSVRNSRLILERWLDYGVVENAVPSRGIDRDSAMASPLEFVRIGLGHEIAQKAARNTNTVVVYLVDPQIERLTAEHSVSQLSDVGDLILQAVRTELAYLPPTAQVPNMLTFTESRLTLQQLIASEFPRMSVIAHEELPPGTNVMPVARIKLEISPSLTTG